MQSQQADQSLFTNCKGVWYFVVFWSVAGIIPVIWGLVSAKIQQNL